MGGLAGYGKRLLRQPDGLVRINEKHWLARDLVFAHTGLLPFIFGAPAPAGGAAIDSFAVAGTRHPQLNGASWFKPDATNYSLFPLPVAGLAFPLTFASWWYGVSGSSANSAVVIRRTLGSDGGLGVQRSSTELAQAAAWSNSGVINSATSTGTFASGAWQHGCAVFVSTTLRTAYLDGGGKVDNTTSRTFPSDCNVVAIALSGSGAVANTDLQGIAHPLIVGRALGDDEVARLYAEQVADPWALFSERPIWVPVSASLPSLSSATYVPGSLTSVGFRPRVTAS